MAYPVEPITRPSELNGQDNGWLSADILVAIAGGMLLRNPARAWNAFVSAASKAGIVLEPTSPSDTYRSFYTQVRLFETNYRPGYNILSTTTDWKIWKGQKWYRKRGKATAAIPGTSNHGWGLAVDVADSYGHRLVWMLDNAHRFGFTWEIQSEPWHIRYVLGDQVTKAVLEYEASFVPTPPTPAVLPNKRPKNDDMLTSTLPDDGSGHVFLVDARTRSWVQNGDDFQQYCWNDLCLHGGKPQGSPFYQPAKVMPADTIRRLTPVGPQPPGY